MAWSVPLTAVSNATLTAAQWNASVRDNLLETAPAKASAQGAYFVTTAANTIGERMPSVGQVIDSETRNSTSYGSLATAGPSITVNTGTRALVIVSAFMSNNGPNSSYMSWAVSGATTIAAADTWALEHRDSSTNGTCNASRLHLETALTPGSNTFTSVYRVSGGTGTFQRRHIVLLPF